MRISTFLAATIVAGALLTPHAQSQAPAQQSAPPPFRAAVDAVQFDVSVLDKNRQPVKGLTAADFVAFENGVPQQIVAFEAVDIPERTELPAPWMRETAPDIATNEKAARRIVVIVFDDAFVPSDPWNAQTAKRIARDVVDSLGPADLAAVTFTFMGTRQDITSDRRALMKAIDSFIPHPFAGGGGGGGGLGNASRGGGGTLSSTLGRGSPGTPCSFRGKYRSVGACVIDTLINVGNALQAAPQGRKTIVYLSSGVPFDFSMPGLTGLSGDSVSGEEVLAIQAVLKSLQEANVNIYAIDPKGVTADGIVGPSQDSLRMFAEDTGGRATLFANTPWAAVPQIFKENSSYYLLGVRSDNRRDGRFHRIQIKVNRPDVEVRTRTGYYSAPAPNAKADARAAAAGPVSALDKAFGQGVPGGDLPIAAAIAAFAVPGQKAAALAIATRLREPVQTSGQTFELGVMALDPECGQCKKLPSNRLSFQVVLPPGATSVPQPEILARLSLNPGTYQIRVAATLDDRAGRVFASVEVPDFQKARLSASGLVLSAPASVQTGRKEVLADILPVVPTALRDFRPDAKVSAFLRIYQGGSKPPGAVRLTATIRDAANATKFDQTVFLDSAQFNRTRSTDYRVDLPIGTLQSGAHLLTIEAHLGDVTIKRDATFSVR